MIWNAQNDQFEFWWTNLFSLKSTNLKEKFGLFVDFEFDGNGLFGHRLIDSRWFEKNSPTECGWKRRSKKKNAHVLVFRAEMLVTQ